MSGGVGAEEAIPSATRLGGSVMILSIEQYRECERPCWAGGHSIQVELFRCGRLVSANLVLVLAYRLPKIETTVR